MKTKYIFNLLIIFAILSYLTSCEVEEGENLPYPSETEFGIIPKISKTANSDGSINLYKRGATNFEFDVEVLDGEYSKLYLCVAYNENYAYDRQYVIKEIESVPSTVTVNINDIVSSVDELNDTTDLQPGDKFEFFINVEKSNGDMLRAFIHDGSVNDGEKVYTWGYNSNLRGNPNHNLFITALAAFPYIPEEYEATYNVEEVTLSDGAISTYQTTAEIDPDQPENGLIIHDLWVAGSEFRIDIDPSTFEVTAEKQIVYDQDFAGYGRVSFEKTREGIINTATKVITFTTQPNLPDAGLWWGTDVKYTLTKVTKGQKNSVEAEKRRNYDDLIQDR